MRPLCSGTIWAVSLVNMAALPVSHAAPPITAKALAAAHTQSPATTTAAAAPSSAADGWMVAYGGETGELVTLLAAAHALLDRPSLPLLSLHYIAAILSLSLNPVPF